MNRRQAIQTSIATLIPASLLNQTQNTHAQEPAQIDGKIFANFGCPNSNIEIIQNPDIHLELTNFFIEHNKGIQFSLQAGFSKTNDQHHFIFTDNDYSFNTEKNTLTTPTTCHNHNKSHKICHIYYENIWLYSIKYS